MCGIFCASVCDIFCASVCDIKKYYRIKKNTLYTSWAITVVINAKKLEKNVYIYLSKTNNLKNVSVWHWKKFWILTRQSKEVWEVARYVFLNGMPSPLIVVKSILMNFEHIWITYFDVTHWRTVQFSGDCPICKYVLGKRSWPAWTS